jgi:hypothetical protein
MRRVGGREVEDEAARTEALRRVGMSEWDRGLRGGVPRHFISRPPQAGRQTAGLSAITLLPCHFIRRALRGRLRRSLASCGRPPPGLPSHFISRAQQGERRLRGLPLPCFGPPLRRGRRAPWGSVAAPAASIGRVARCGRCTFLRHLAAGDSLPATRTPCSCRREGRRSKRIRGDAG